MPELPEVETTVRGLREKVVGKTITAFWCDHGRMVRYVSVKRFGKLVRGAKIGGVRRRGKNILIDLSPSTSLGVNKTIVVHMKMTGHLLYGKYAQTGSKDRPWVPVLKDGPLGDPYNRFIHAVFTLSGPATPRLRRTKMHLAFSDMRKFGKIALHDTANLHTAKELIDLGPELWELETKKFIEILKLKKSGRIKQVLLDQTVLAGVGNIYSDEGLWAASIHPLSKPSKIPEANLKKLFQELVKVTKRSLATGGDSMSDYRNVDGVGGKFQNFHKAYRQNNKKCVKKDCNGMMERIVVGSRSAHFCPKHQRLYV